MYLHVFIITFAAWISFSLAQVNKDKIILAACQQCRKQSIIDNTKRKIPPVNLDPGVESNFDLYGPCNKENDGRRKLIKGSDGKAILIVCSKNNGVYSWKKDVMKTKIHTDVMEDVMMKRKAATEFFQRDRRDLNHECYTECCSWEEVREHYEHDIPAAIKYWNTYQSHGCKGR